MCYTYIQWQACKQDDLDFILEQCLAKAYFVSDMAESLSDDLWFVITYLLADTV